MSELVKFNYLNNKEYNKTVDKIDCFKSLNRDDKVYGVIGHGKKQIGTITLNDKEYKVYNKKSYKNFWHRTVGYVQVADHAYLRLVKLNPIAFLLLGVIGALIIAGGILGFTLIGTASADDEMLTPDDNAEYVGEIGYSVGGQVVDQDGNPLTGAVVTLNSGSTSLAEMNSNGTGSFMYRNVTDGYYMLTVEYNGKTVTKMVRVNTADQLIEVVVHLDKENGNSEVTIDKEDDTPYAIGDADKEAQNTDTNINVSIRQATLSKEAKQAIPEAITTLDNVTYVVEVKVNNVKVNKTEDVLRVVVPFDATDLAKFAVVRYNDGQTTMFQESTDGTDGTYVIDGKNVVLYAKSFGEFLFAYEEQELKTELTETVVGYEEYVDIDLTTGEADFYFYHKGEGVTAVLDFVVYKTDGSEKVLTTTGAINSGYKIETTTLGEDILNILPEGNYSGLIRVRYTSETESTVNTNVELPVTFRVH